MQCLLRGITYLREVLISMWIPKVMALIRGRNLFEAWHLLEEIWYTHTRFDLKNATKYKRKVKGVEVVLKFPQLGN